MEKYPKTQLHWTAYLQWVNFMVHRLHLNKGGDREDDKKTSRETADPVRVADSTGLGQGGRGKAMSGGQMQNNCEEHAQ